MLISPMLHQGGFERVCITTARLLEPYFDITIVIFDSADIAYGVEGLTIIDISAWGPQRKAAKAFEYCQALPQSERTQKKDAACYCLQLWPHGKHGKRFFQDGKRKGVAGTSQLHGRGGNGKDQIVCEAGGSDDLLLPGN